MTDQQPSRSTRAVLDRPAKAEALTKINTRGTTPRAGSVEAAAAGAYKAAQAVRKIKDEEIDYLRAQLEESDKYIQQLVGELGQTKRSMKKARDSLKPKKKQKK